MTRSLRTRIAPLFLLLLPLTALPRASAADVAPSAQVVVAALRKGQLAEQAHALGTVQAASSQTLAVNFPRTVQVLKVEVRPGQTVRRGQPLLQVQGAPGSDLPFMQAQSAVAYAQSDLQRLEQLQGQQLATTSQVDAARKALADAQAQLAAARAQGLGGGRATQTAPFDGLVTAVQTQAGAQLAAGSAALLLAPANRLQATVGVLPEQARLLRPGMTAQVQAVFDPDQTAQATVLNVAGLIDPATGRVNVTLALPAQPWLLPGLAVQALLPLRTWSGWVVPRNAVLRDAHGQAYVFQDDHGRARRVKVSVEIDQAESSGVVGPLDPALPLVVLGNYELENGMALRTGAAANTKGGQ